MPEDRRRRKNIALLLVLSGLALLLYLLTFVKVGHLGATGG